MNIMPYLLFAFVASITPCPTNILVLTSSQHYGVRATLPALVSGCVAASAIVLISGAGAGELLRQYPLVRRDELGGCTVADMDELAAVLCSGNEYCWANAPSLYCQSSGTVADYQSQNVDDGAGGGESVCPYG